MVLFHSVRGLKALILYAREIALGDAFFSDDIGLSTPAESH
jgi:hypothetical protein